MATNPYASPGGAANLGIGGNSYGGSNPYLQDNIDKTMGDVSRQYNNSIAPQRANAAASSGSFGNSGQQAMQLEEQRNFGQTLANTNSQMRMADYTQQQSMYQQDKTHDFNDRNMAQQGVLANRGMDIQSQGQNLNYQLGLKQNDTQRYGIDTGAATSRYGADSSAASNRYGVDAGERTASMNNATNMRGQDLNYQLGLRQNDTSLYSINTNAGTNKYGVDAGTANNRYTTDAAAATARAANDTSNRSINANYDLGLRGNDLQNDQLDANISNSNFNNQMRGAEFGQNTYNNLQNNNNLGLGAGKTMQNAPLDYQTQYGNSVNAAAGQGAQVASTSPGGVGSPLTGAIGGAQLGNSMYKQFGGGSNNPYQGYDPMGQYGNGVGSYLKGNGGSGD